MNRIGRTKALLACVLIGIMTAGVSLVSAQSAADWGGSITSNNTVRSVPDGSDDDSVLATQRLTLYLTAPLGTRWEFTAQGAAFLDTAPVFAADVERFFFSRTNRFADGQALDREKASVEQASGLIQTTGRIGRFTLAEPTGLVMRHTVDGMGVTIDGVRSRIQLGAGYTGFINKEFSRASLSLRDSADGDDDDIYFGPARLLGRGSLALPNLIAGQNLTVAFAFQQDLRDPESVVEQGTEPDDVEELGGLVDTQYAILQLNGPVPGVGSLFYTATYVLNTGRTLSLVEDNEANSGESYQYQPITGHLVRGRLQYFIPQFFSAAATAGVLYSSGDEDYTRFVEGNTADDATMFTAVTPAARGAVFGLESGNSTVGELSFSMKPFSGSGTIAESLLTRLAVFTFFRTAGTGPVSSSDVDAASDGSYLGNEVDIEVRWRPFSDVGLGLTTGFLFANDSVLLDGSNSVDYMLRLNASLSF